MAGVTGCFTPQRSHRTAARSRGPAGQRGRDRNVLTAALRAGVKRQFSPVRSARWACPRRNPLDSPATSTWGGQFPMAQ
jgi:hypothetical protein